MSEILKIKIDRKVAGMRIPYDVIYLFPRDQRGVIPRLWDFALVLPFEDSFKEVIFKLPLSKVSYLKQFRDDDALNMSVGDKDKTNNNKLKTEEATVNIWTDLRSKYALDDRLVVVPVLMSKQREQYKPRYLTSKQWFIRTISRYNNRDRKKGQTKESLFNKAMSATEVAKFEPAVSDLAYMVTPFEAPDNVVRPICSICPRNLQHLQGQCIPGMQVCYETLNFNLKAPEKVSVEDPTLLPAASESI